MMKVLQDSVPFGELWGKNPLPCTFQPPQTHPHFWVQVLSLHLQIHQWQDSLSCLPLPSPRSPITWRPPGKLRSVPLFQGQLISNCNYPLVCGIMLLLFIFFHYYTQRKEGYFYQSFNKGMDVYKCIRYILPRFKAPWYLKEISIWKIM